MCFDKCTPLLLRTFLGFSTRSLFDLLIQTIPSSTSMMFKGGKIRVRFLIMLHQYSNFSCNNISISLFSSIMPMIEIVHLYIIKSIVTFSITKSLAIQSFLYAQWNIERTVLKPSHTLWIGCWNLTLQFLTLHSNKSTSSRTNIHSVTCLCTL